MTLFLTSWYTKSLRLTSGDVVKDGDLLHGDAALGVPLPVNNVSLHAANDHIKNRLLHSVLLLVSLNLGQFQGNLYKRYCDQISWVKVVKRKCYTLLYIGLKPISWKIVVKWNH